MSIRNNYRSTVNGPSCSYVTLSRYNKEKDSQHNDSGATGATGATGASDPTTPQYGEPGYKVLTHGNSGCSGYPKVSDAYRSNGNCSFDYSGGHCG